MPILSDMSKLIIRPVHIFDAQDIVEIYNPYITDTMITFEEEPVSVSELKRRIEKVQTLGLPWICGEVDGNLAGYAYATRWRERSAYRYTAESVIYLKKELAGQGYGSQLYTALIENLKSAGIHVVIGVIALPNPASVALHEKLGFTKVAHFAEVGFKFGNWLDVDYWQRML